MSDDQMIYIKQMLTAIIDNQQVTNAKIDNLDVRLSKVEFTIKTFLY